MTRAKLAHIIFSALEEQEHHAPPTAETFGDLLAGALAGDPLARGRWATAYAIADALMARGVRLPEPIAVEMDRTFRVIRTPDGGFYVVPTTTEESTE